jgi:hypothetical protein
MQELLLNIFYHQDNVPYGCYKIITPKEESTFYTKKCKCMIFEPNCFTGMCKNCGGILKEETKPKTMLESLQEYLKNTPKEKVLEDWNEFQHLDEEGITVKEFLENQKQETLEEAAEKYSENWEEITGLDYENTVPSEVNKLDFINGAKCQQEQNQIKDIIPALVDFKHECINMPSQCKPDNLLYSFDDIKNALLAGINIYQQSISGMYSNSEVFRNKAIKDYLANIQK